MALHERKQTSVYSEFHDDSEESEVDDITWNDLDMDNVFFMDKSYTEFFGGTDTLSSFT